MSIEMENPTTALEMVDAAANLVEQIRLAKAVGDVKHLDECIDRASDLLAQAIELLTFAE